MLYRAPEPGISIPYGSIKSFPLILLCYTVLISIPYGSIKSWRTFWRTSSLYNFISIPYGSIKSHRRAGLEHEEFISIPYGSIKSCSGCRNRLSRILISIPYGSIKRHGDGACGSVLWSFQFLMVRLKAGKSPACALSQSDFNSLWFD